WPPLPCAWPPSCPSGHAGRRRQQPLSDLRRGRQSSGASDAYPRSGLWPFLRKRDAGLLQGVVERGLDSTIELVHLLRFAVDPYVGPTALEANDQLDRLAAVARPDGVARIEALRAALVPIGHARVERLEQLPSLRLTDRHLSEDLVAVEL